jgi:hypothetical protein
MKRTRLQTDFEIQRRTELASATQSERVSMQLPHEREKVAQLLRLFSSARKRPGLSSDEVLIFIAIGYLSMSVSKDIVLMRAVKLLDISRMLGIPKETVRRKTVRLVDVDYVSISRNGVFIKEIEMWCRMLDHSIV